MPSMSPEASSALGPQVLGKRREEEGFCSGWLPASRPFSPTELEKRCIIPVLLNNDPATKGTEML